MAIKKSVVTEGTVSVGELAKSSKAEYLDESNPKALINVVTPVVLECIRKIPDEYFGLSDWDLADKIYEGRPAKRMATMTLENRIRLAFWREYVVAINSGKRMRMLEVYRGICGNDHFYHTMNRPLCAAWILNPPPEESIVLEESYQHALTRVREILDLPLYDKMGFASPAVAGQILRAAEFLGNRLHGAPTQKIESKTLRVNVGGRMLKAASPQDPKAQGNGYEQVASEIRFLEGKARAAEDILKVGVVNAEGPTEEK